MPSLTCIKTQFLTKSINKIRVRKGEEIIIVYEKWKNHGSYTYFINFFFHLLQGYVHTEIRSKTVIAFHISSGIEIDYNTRR